LVALLYMIVRGEGQNLDRKERRDDSSRPTERACGLAGETSPGAVGAVKGFRSVGLRVCAPAGLRVFGGLVSAGLLVYGFVGSEDLRVYALSVYGVVGLQVCGSTGLRADQCVGLWFYGSANVYRYAAGQIRVSRSAGPPVSRYPGLRICGSTGLRLYGSVAIQVCGSTGLRVYGYLWICGFVNPRRSPTWMPPGGLGYPGVVLIEPSSI
jgi:hypothetical protein